MKRGEQSGFAAKPTHLNFNTCQTYDRLGIIWEEGGLPDISELLFPLSSTRLLSLAWFFFLYGLEPQGTALTAGHFDRRIRSVFFQPSICATSQDAKVWRIPLTTLGAREWSDYGLLLWKKLGSCCWAAPWGVILALLFWDGNQNVPLQTDSVSQRLPEKTEDGQTRVSMILIKFVCFYAKEWCLFSL